MKMSRAITCIVLVGSMGLTAAAQAQTFPQTHPRRAEVNGRLGDQNARITRGVRDGRLSHQQAHRLRADDRSIRTEERADASVNGGHITRSEKRQINQRENANSAAIQGERRN
jgi:hypothetical protein